MPTTNRQPSFRYQKEGVQIAMWHSPFGLVDPGSVKVKITLENYNNKTKKFQKSDYWTLEGLVALEEGMKELELHLSAVLA